MFKNYPIIRHIFYGLFIFIPMFILSPIIYPLAYVLRAWIRKVNFIPLWIFLNDSENNDYGAEWWHKQEGYNLATASKWQKFVISYRYNAIRNPHWNLKLAIQPNKGDKHDIKIHFNTTNQGGLIFCNYNVLGKQYATYRIGNEKYFRYSFTIPINGYLWNVMLGTDSRRYIYKNRFKKL